MYLLILSGTLAVFDDELHRWEQPRAVEIEGLAPSAVQAAIERSARGTDKMAPATVVHLPSASSPRATLLDSGGLQYLDSSGQPDGQVHTPWSDFLMGLHFYLNLPEVWGLALVGALGVMLMALTVTGVLALPRIFRDAFRFNPRASRQLALVDWHNRLSVWTLPFGIAVAFTGAVLGVMTPGAVAMSALHLAPGEAAVFAPVFGGAPPPAKELAPLPNVSAALQYMSSRHPRSVPTDVIVRNGGTASEDVEILAAEPQRLIVGEYYLFDAHGRFTGTVGLSRGQAGQQLAASMYRLHFGNFGGLAMKLAYFLFGLALTVVSGTGVSIWLMKRRRRGMGLPAAERLWASVVWGSPLLLALAYCLGLIGASQAGMTAFFWGGFAAALGAAAFVDLDAAKLGRDLRIVLAAVLLTIAVGHSAVTDWSRVGILIIDAALVLTAAALLFAGTGRRSLPLTGEDRQSSARQVDARSGKASLMSAMGEVES
jgi:uncharacterized iron-regulated membrane protein